MCATTGPPAPSPPGRACANTPPHCPRLARTREMETSQVKSLQQVFQTHFFSSSLHSLFAWIHCIYEHNNKIPAQEKSINYTVHTPRVQNTARTSRDTRLSAAAGSPRLGLLCSVTGRGPAEEGWDQDRDRDQLKSTDPNGSVPPEQRFRADFSNGAPGPRAAPPGNLSERATVWPLLRPAASRSSGAQPRNPCSQEPCQVSQRHSKVWEPSIWRDVRGCCPFMLSQGFFPKVTSPPWGRTQDTKGQQINR